jgi:putative NIF3 family GTP cyclohydrolase 1 type 2
VQRVVACGGAGDSLVQAAVDAGADVYVTGDLRHHVVLDALTQHLTVIDAGHYATERAALPALHDRLAAMATDRGLRAGLLASSTTTEPWSDYCAHHEAKAGP